MREDGGLARLVVVHSEPRKASLAREISQPLAARAGGSDRPGQVVRTGELEMIEEVADAAVVPWVRDDEHAARPAGAGRRLLHLRPRPLAAQGARGADLRDRATGSALRGERPPRRRGPGLSHVGGHRERRALPDGGGGGPAQGRVPGRPVPRAADAAQRDRGLDPRAARGASAVPR